MTEQETGIRASFISVARYFKQFHLLIPQNRSCQYLIDAGVEVRNYLLSVKMLDSYV